MSIGRAINTMIAPLGVALQKIQKKTSPNLEIYRRLYPYDSVAQRRFYNIGAGKFSHPAWTNVDLHSDHYASSQKEDFISHDLLSLKPIPIEDSSAEVIYTSHTVEHITDAAAQNLFNDAYRVLKPDGFLRITTPNIDLGYEAYKANDRDLFYWSQAHSVSVGQIFLNHFASSVTPRHPGGNSIRIDDEKMAQLFRDLPYEDALNYCTARCPLDIQRQHPGNHINWWNETKLTRMLKAAGFSKVYLSAYGQSKCPVLRDTNYFDSRHPRISIYMEAKR